MPGVFIIIIDRVVGLADQENIKDVAHLDFSKAFGKAVPRGPFEQAAKKCDRNQAGQEAAHHAACGLHKASGAFCSSQSHPEASIMILKNNYFLSWRLPDATGLH